MPIAWVAMPTLQKQGAELVRGCRYQSFLPCQEGSHWLTSFISSLVTTDPRGDDKTGLFDVPEGTPNACMHSRPTQYPFTNIPHHGHRVRLGWARLEQKCNLVTVVREGGSSLPQYVGEPPYQEGSGIRTNY